jgi:hypothetical protein
MTGLRRLVILLGATLTMIEPASFLVVLAAIAAGGFFAFRRKLSRGGW